MQVDSGAEVNIMSVDTYNSIIRKSPLRNTSAKLRPYASKPISLKGCFRATVCANGKQVNTTFYVTDNTKTAPILGKYTAFDLNILKINLNELVTQDQPQQQRSQQTVKQLTYTEMSNILTPLAVGSTYVHQLHQHPTTVEVTQQIINKHPNVFKGIGRHKYRQVKLNIDKAIHPKIQPQRRIPFAKRQQFDNILQELEDADIIEPVEGPTEWLSNVVLTPKADPSQLRMNIDMTTANTAIKRTRHVIPTVEELRYKLNGAKYFTKLDMKHGYMQLELTHESRYMTTFYAHRGLRQFKCLNFGTNSAAEQFNEEISQIMPDIENADNIYDDILVYGKTQKEHNVVFEQVLQRLEDCGLTLGLQKCRFNQPTIEFLWAAVLCRRSITNPGQDHSSYTSRKADIRLRNSLISRHGKLQRQFRTTLLRTLFASGKTWKTQGIIQI